MLTSGGIWAEPHAVSDHEDYCGMWEPKRRDCFAVVSQKSVILTKVAKPWSSASPTVPEAGRPLACSSPAAHWAQHVCPISIARAIGFPIEVSGQLQCSVLGNGRLTERQLVCLVFSGSVHGNGESLIVSHLGDRMPQRAYWCRDIQAYCVTCSDCNTNAQLETKLRGLSPRANYTDRATCACRRS
jgi:hypothetical protein